jgi:hypothetical protein
LLGVINGNEYRDEVKSIINEKLKLHPFRGISAHRVSRLEALALLVGIYLVLEKILVNDECPAICKQ